MPQLYIQKSCLQVIQQTGETMTVILTCFSVFSVISHASCKEGNLRIICCDCSTVTVSTKDFKWIKAPASSKSPGTTLFAVHACPETLACILDHNQVVFFSYLHDTDHISHISIKMDRYNCLCFRCNSLFYLVNINIEILININQHGCCTCIHNCRACCNKCMRWNNDLIVMSNASSP